MVACLAQYDLSVLEDAERASAERARLVGGVWQRAEEPKPLTPRGVASLALTDATRLSKDDLPFIRYVWLNEPTPEAPGAVSYTLNCLSHATTPYRPEVVGNGHLVRLDARRLAPRDADLDRFLKVWDSLAAQDPYFHVHSKIKVKPYKAADGKVYDYSGWKTEFALHVQPAILVLADLTASELPIVRADWFLVKALSVENNGKYYQFRAAPGTQAEWLKLAGSDEAQVAALRSDSRAAMFRSNVTGKPRRVDAFFGIGTRPTAGSGLITITRDVADGDIAAEQDPIRNLLNFTDAAREAFRTLPNGYREAMLFDGQGQRQNAAPPDVASDATVPHPHSQIVQPIISCLRCHGGLDMVQDARNDVLKLLAGGVNVYDDLSSNEGRDDTLDRLAGQYSAELTEPLQRARDDHARAVFVSTGLRVPVATGEIGRLYNAYEYDLVTPEIACRELGVPEGDAETFDKLVPRLPKNAFGFSPEDPIIGALRAGLGINRRQWEQIYSDCAVRAMAGGVK